ncbi:hypothetical protein [Salinicoccus sediminis]|uniref:hypothetical protein n=1 Tax=Salinicoccus sediminis TaxID=1432562 RepID=UPI0012E0273B|nr:hypothetical protein [Salinicoccus sediminis]
MNNELNCLCDTNIWINVSCINRHTKYLDCYRIVGFVEQVHNEIVKFKNSENTHKIFKDYDECKKDYKVLEIDELGDMKPHFVMELKRRGFNELDNSDKTIKNLGEYVSLYFAYYKDIVFIHSEDNEFMDDVSLSEFKNINVIGWNEVAGNITKDDNERLKINKEVQERRSNIFDPKKKNQRNSKGTLKDRMAKMQKNINSKRL